MIRVRHTIDIAAPPEAVWAVLEDVERWPDWAPDTKSIVRRGSGAFGPGSEARVTMRGARGSVWRVTEYEAGRAFTWDTALMPGLRMSAEHAVEASEVGSRATLTLDMEGPFAALFRRRAEGSVGREAAGLKGAAEARSR